MLQLWQANFHITWNKTSKNLPLCFISSWEVCVWDSWGRNVMLRMPFVLALSKAIAKSVLYSRHLSHIENKLVEIFYCVLFLPGNCVSGTHGDGMWCRECLLCSLCQKRLTTRILTSIFSIPRFLIILQKLGSDIARVRLWKDFNYIFWFPPMFSLFWVVKARLQYIYNL